MRKDFPILNQTIYNNKPLIYLDNAATSQKPQIVIDTLVEYYTRYNANIHRGVHYLSQRASQAYDDVRSKAAAFINASSDREIVFVRGTTEAINLVASSWGLQNITPGDEIIVSQMEHHSNIVPWQMLCQKSGGVLKIIPITDKGELIIEEYIKLLSPRTKLVALVHTSNSLGTINPVEKIIQLAHNNGTLVLIDGAQAVAHEVVDVQKMDADFFVFSSHKMCGPTGVGVLYAKQHILETMPPYQGGGDMIKTVSFPKTLYNDIPFRFEAGTQNIADVIAFGTAIDYLNSLDRSSCAAQELQLMAYTSQHLQKIEKVKLIGTANNKASVVSFIIDGVNAMDAGMYLDTMGIAVRTGQHCTEPLMTRLGIAGTIRASFLFYNTIDEAKALADGVTRVVGAF